MTAFEARILQMFRSGMRTDAIAKAVNQREAVVANALAAARDRDFERRRGAA